jgi:fatty acid desaturase
MIQPAESSAFSLAQTRHIVKDLFEPNPLVYWADFLVSAIGGLICLQLVRRGLGTFSLALVVEFIICCLLLYRAVLFTHEMAHLRAGTFRGFRVAWNLLCGIPFLLPSFMYYTHVDHHMRKHYSTEHDGEYLPLATGSPWHILIYLCQPFVLPLIAVVRFLILAPISWVSPTFRRFVQQRASSMVMDPTYIRPLPARKVLRMFRLQEALCFLWLVGAIVLLIVGWLPFTLVITAYLVSVTIMMLNSIRTLGAHRYTSTGGEVTFLDQLLDSVNYPNRPFLSSLWAPVGLRFHALHHLFPSLPYHNLAKAHKRLMAELPANSPYRLTESPSLMATLVELWRASRASVAQSADEPRHVSPRRHLSGASNRLTGAPS